MLSQIQEEIAERSKELVEIAIGIKNIVEQSRRAVPAELSGSEKQDVMTMATLLYGAQMIVDALDRQSQSSNNYNQEFVRIINMQAKP